VVTEALTGPEWIVTEVSPMVTGDPLRHAECATGHTVAAVPYASPAAPAGPRTVSAHAAILHRSPGVCLGVAILISSAVCWR